MILFIHTHSVMHRAIISFCFLLLLVTPGIARQDLSSVQIQDASTLIVHVANTSIQPDASDFFVRSADGREIGIDAVLPKRSMSYLLVPAEELDPRRLHTLYFRPTGEERFIRRDAWFSTLYSDKKLGATIASDGSSTTFRLFAPRAFGVELHLFADRETPTSRPDRTVLMSVDDDGVWEATEPGNHHGVYYTYTIHGPSDRGNYFFETYPIHVTDPYALVSDDSYGKARVWQDTPPPPPVVGGRPPMEDVIAYEVHVQDFTDMLPIDVAGSGALRAMATPGLRNARGQAVGFDHLVDLGVNVVHLMPVQEYLHYPDEEWQAAFRDDPYMMEQGIAEENYQWGYRTTHAFAVESRFRDPLAEPGEERAQFKALVEAFHEKGLSVIIDVVPNHTGENMDGRHLLFNFNAIDLPFYYRTDDSLRHIGPFGNEIKSEERPMVQRWILDQLRHWIDELGVDGFRIDLAGQIDEQTLRWVKDQLPEDVIIYGEAWIPPTDPVVASDPDFGWYKADAPITYFQDDARNAFKGPVSNPQDPRTDRGFAGGDGTVRDRAKLGLTNGFPEELDPNRGINYLDIHDNWTLADRFSDTDWNGLVHVDEPAFRIAAALLTTSLGPIVLHGGTEIMRSKGVAPLVELVKETESGPIYIHGKRDTYNLRRANHYLWDTVGATSPMDYDAMLAFWRGLLTFRMSADGSVFRVGGDVPEPGYYRFFEPERTDMLGYLIDSRVLVLINAGRQEGLFTDLALPVADWVQISDGQRVYPDGREDPTVDPAKASAVPVPAQTALIWVRR